MRDSTVSSAKQEFKLSKKIIKVTKRQSNHKGAKDFHLLRKRQIHKNPPEAQTHRLLENQTQQTEKLCALEDYQSFPLIPEVHLSASEFLDPISSIVKLREKYENYGAVKICPPHKWKPEFCFLTSEHFVTVRQQVLQELTKGKTFDQRVEEYAKNEYESMALKFSQSYKYQRATDFKDPILANEQEYWHLVDNPTTTKQVEVEYAADLSSLKFGSGFPAVDSTAESKKKAAGANPHPFNLNNLSNAPDSLFQILTKKQDKISGISSPWMYMGMLFASFCWHIEDCYMYSANYMHKGEAKTWYIVPGSYKEAVENLMKKTYADIFAKRPNILNQIILQLNPLEFKKHGIPVYKTHQKPREFIITFPKAFHSGFSHGFNVSEAVNFVTLDWLQYLKEAQKDYKAMGFCKKLIFPIDWLVCENYWKMESFQMSQGLKNNIRKEFLEVLKNESEMRKAFWSKTAGLKLKIKVEPMKKQHYDKTICFFCKNYSYLSYLKCENCQRKICLMHAEKRCCELRKITMFCKLSDQELLSAN